jgi:hypothetical protein
MCVDYLRVQVKSDARVTAAKRAGSLSEVNQFTDRWVAE